VRCLLKMDAVNMKKFFVCVSKYRVLELAGEVYCQDEGSSFFFKK
jgi:hypothetical protein